MFGKLVKDARSGFYKLPIFQHSHAREVFVRLDNLNEISKLTYWSQRKPFLRIHVPTELVVMEGGFQYSAECNPFVAMLEEGRDALIRHYENFQPKNLRELYSLQERGLAGENEATNLVAWMLTSAPKLDTGELGLGPEHGRSYFGPVTRQKLELEVNRLESTRTSILTKGYQPNRHGDISGYFIRRGNEFRFLVRGGKHRAAVLAHLGEATIPVRMKPGWPRMIDNYYVEEWPAVQSGLIDKQLALDIFDRFFDGLPLKELYR